MNKLIYIPERVILICLLIFVSVSTSISGVLMMMQPGSSFGALPLELFEYPDFHDYFVPGFMLSVIVGSTHLVALILILENHPQQYSSVRLGAFLLLLWIVSHMYMTEIFHWMQVLYLSISIIILLLSASLSRQKHLLDHPKC